MFTDLLIATLNQAATAPAATNQSLAGTITGLLPMILMFGVLWFLLVRPQMKRQKEHRKMVETLAVGNEVITTGGILGKITHLTDNYITLDISKSDQVVEILLQRVAIAAVLPKGTIKDL
ncbi:preprotein translocase subunit YajC [Taylorella equigenitalis]|uniref:Sec translocon accessory complex subunit YajC n=3 Tax=Taylorella equigenitalis TaxID=29575 RepID=A0A654KFW4_TAYEM|nr:preprotein translocase subunit YajC [Taylorella equigenitalis]ADU91311.1 Preprotein translocase subunit YajC [Taylorella equigenitalis MCE9]AFN36406.1 putative exported protein [Taylorella equigenitalis ATCC 35865]ASY30975.1 preprotein translocase subunit YajC [Taylorella equigenitalis]ASY38279.1 preprotein translocase subunit YajC [Taylorella equigenitalis]ASY39808.1 preprotein translocase subunit YajC [Taylorella equigenitalis]